MSQDLTVYEQPLNERIRAFLRLEHLFEQARQRIADGSSWDTRKSVDSVLEILALLGRADLRTELIKELERQLHAFEGLSGNPGVDAGRLSSVIEQIRQLTGVLRSNEATPGQELREHELLNAIRQRNSIPAGTCSFDLPCYKFWLESDHALRAAEIESWLDEFNLYRDSVRLSLDLIRGSAASTREVASGGFFQRSMDATNSCQMVRVLFPREHRCFPEISGGKHRFSVRFMRLDNASQRAVQSDEDVEFELQCCVI